MSETPSVQPMLLQRAEEFRALLKEIDHYYPDHLHEAKDADLLALNALTDGQDETVVAEVRRRGGHYAERAQRFGAVAPPQP